MNLEKITRTTREPNFLENLLPYKIRRSISAQRLTLLSSSLGGATLAPVVELEVRVGALALLPAQVTRRRVSLAVVTADVFARRPCPVWTAVRRAFFLQQEQKHQNLITCCRLFKLTKSSLNTNFRVKKANKNMKLQKF